MSSFIDYLKSTRGELKHVNWPTRRQAVVYTAIVVVISVAVGAYLGVLDYIFTGLLRIFFF